MNFLLRTPKIFDDDEVIQKYVKAGKARLLKGDGLVKQDLQLAWEEAGKERPVDVLFFSVGKNQTFTWDASLISLLYIGGIPKFDMSKGFLISPANLVTQCLLNTLCTMPEQYRGPSSQLRFAVVTSGGITASSHAALPLLMKPVFMMLKQPHKDKIGAERVIHHVAGWPFDVKDFGEPGEDIMGPNWMGREGLPEAGSFNNFLVVRPALLTDGECVADKEETKKKNKTPYKVSEKELGSYTVSRKDTAHFIADAVVSNWSQYGKKIVNVGY